MIDPVTVIRQPLTAEVCILHVGGSRGIFISQEIVDWLRANDIAWTVTGTPQRLTFTFTDAVSRMLFAIRFGHLTPPA